MEAVIVSYGKKPWSFAFGEAIFYLEVQEEEFKEVVM